MTALAVLFAISLAAPNIGHTLAAGKGIFWPGTVAISRRLANRGPPQDRRQACGCAVVRLTHL
jgi:hypothetical protein